MGFPQANSYAGCTGPRSVWSAHAALQRCPVAILTCVTRLSQPLTPHPWPEETSLEYAQKKMKWFWLLCPSQNPLGEWFTTLIIASSCTWITTENPLSVLLRHCPDVLINTSSLHPPPVVKSIKDIPKEKERSDKLTSGSWSSVRFLWINFLKYNGHVDFSQQS